jgi:hypothetical protein
MNKITQTLGSLFRSPTFLFSLAITNHSILTYRILSETVTPWHIITLIAAIGTTWAAVWELHMRSEQRLEEIRQSINGSILDETRRRLQQVDNIYNVLTDVITIQGKVIDKLEER